MFIKQLEDQEQVWEFILINNSTFIGKVMNYVVDPNGHLMFVQVLGVLGLWDVPLTSVVRVRQYREDRD